MSLSNLQEKVDLISEIVKGPPPGPPPRPGLKWRSRTSRWVCPEEGCEESHTHGKTYKKPNLQNKPDVSGEEKVTGEFQSLRDRSDYSRKEVSEKIKTLEDEFLRESFSSRLLQDSILREYSKFKWGDQNSQIIDGDVFDNVKTNLMIRGIGDIKHLKSNLDGSFTGVGVYGNGQYYSYGDNLESGIDYGDTKEGWVHFAKLHPEANIATDEDVANLMAERAEGSSPGIFGGNVGRQAAKAGFDAIQYEHPAYIVVLNRKSLLVDKRSLPNGEYVKGKSVNKRFWKDLLYKYGDST